MQQINELHENNNLSAQDLDHNICSRNGIILFYKILQLIPVKLISKDYLDVIHIDIFNQDDEISISALNLLSKIGNQSSYNYLLQIIKEYPINRKLASINTLYSIGDETIIEPLYKYFQLDFDEDVRIAILKTISKYGNKNNDVKKLIISYSDSELHDSPVRLQAIKSLQDLGEWEILKNLMSTDNRNVVIASIETLANFKQIDALFLLKRLITIFNTLHSDVQITLIKALCIQQYEPVLEVLFKSLFQNDEDNLKKIFQIMKDNIDFLIKYPQRVFKYFLKLPAYSSYIENELLELIILLKDNITDVEIVKGFSLLVDATTRTYFSKIESKYEANVLKGSQIEINVAHSKEFIEKFCDQAFFKAIINCLKSPDGYSTSNKFYNEAMTLINEKSKDINESFGTHIRSLKVLLGTMDKLQRNRIASLFSGIDFDKKVHVARLIRYINIISVFKNQRSGDISYDIYLWANKMNESDLMHNSLLSASRCKYKSIAREIEQILNNKNSDKHLVLTAIKSIGEYGNPDFLSPIFPWIEERDISTCDEDILIAITETIRKVAQRFEYPVERALLKIFTTSTSNTAIYYSALDLSQLASPKIIGTLAKYKNSPNEKIRELLVFILGSFAENFKLERSIMQNFLYTMLKDNSFNVKLSVLVALYRLNDDYSNEIMKEIFAVREPDLIAEAILQTIEIDAIDRIKILFNCINIDSDAVYLALKHAFTALIESNTTNIKYILKSFLNYRLKSVAEHKDQLLSSLGEIKIDLSKSIEREKYIFEKKHTRELSILFVDICGYTSKSSKMNLMEIMSYLKSYEEIALPIFLSHSGKVVKKMGDGLMIAFSIPTYAVLAGIRLQEKLRNYNLFKPDKYKIIVRVGINSGSVAIQNNDLFGDTVNVASRMETAAEPGKVLISEATYEKTKTFFQFHPMGPTKVKGKTEEINTFEVLGISVALPDELDPHKTPPLIEDRIIGKDENAGSSTELFIPEHFSDVNIIRVKESILDLINFLQNYDNFEQKEVIIKKIMSCWNNIIKK